MPETRPPRLAVLIDADNTSAKIVDGLFEAIATLGEASVRRIYGDFSSPRLKSWSGVLAKYAILATQQFANTTGKNSSDIALVIEAMDLLHSGRFDGFCLVSSDSDFTRLAQRIREQGIDVFGFGEQKTPESFRQACRRFINTELLSPRSAHAEKPGEPPNPLAAIERTLGRLLAEVVTPDDDDEGWVLLGLLGNRLANFAPDFDARTYGYKKLSDLVRSLESFELKTKEGRLMVRRIAKKAAVRASPKA